MSNKARVNKARVIKSIYELLYLNLAQDEKLYQFAYGIALL